MDMEAVPKPPSPPRAAAQDSQRGGGVFWWPGGAAVRAAARGLLAPADGILRPLLLALTCFSVALIVIAFSGPRQTAAPFSKPRFYTTPQEGEHGLFGSSDGKRDRLLGGLLAPGFDERSCLSRYGMGLLRKQSPYSPSLHLLKRLREQEELQKKCGQETESYSRSLEQLESGRASGNSECKYVVWTPYCGGLGNRILSLASTFLFSLLTNRVLLIERGDDMADLFCEPFPENSWLLPLDFPLKFRDLDTFNLRSNQSYGNMLKYNVISNQFHGDSIGSLPSYAYLHLMYDYSNFDKLFFCEDDQRLLGNIPWLLLRSNYYFVPSLFLIPAYQEELEKLFPQKDTVFHHLGRYLFHPTNEIWGLITRYYQSYLANYDERIGLQIRVFDEPPFRQNVLNQVLGCSLKEKLLPEINFQDPVSSTANISFKSVLVTSLSGGYSEQIRNMYWEYPTSAGEIIIVHQPSHEELQQSEKKKHNFKALSEMYLLSATDFLVTSPWSTFGYVAQGLGGLKPWILVKPEGDKVPDPPCRRAMSMEPCFHEPPYIDCKTKTGMDPGTLVPHVRHCEDRFWGLKLTNGYEE